MADENYQRKLTAILSADVVGYSRLMREDEDTTFRNLKAYRRLISKKITEFKGRVVDSPGDNVLAEFNSIVDAVSCAVKIQDKLYTENEKFPAEKRMVFRVGVHLGDVIHDGKQIYGDGVNIAARIESLAKPGEIAISGMAFNTIRSKLNFGFEFMGEQAVKNIDQPVAVYRVLTDPKDAGKIVGEPKEDKNTASKTILAIAVVILVVAASYVYIAYSPPDNISTPKTTISVEAEIPSIAVLPFINMSEDPKQEYFSDGMTDDLITDLSKIPGLKVISRNSSFTYKGKAVPIQAVGRALGVKYILEGSVRRIDDQIRINAQLIDADNDLHIWADRYDGQMADVFDLQDKITDNIVKALAVNLTAGEKGSRREYETQNMQAYDAFLKGWNYFLRQTPEDVPKAIPHLKNAIEIDPDYSRAYAALALVYWRAVDQGWRKQLKLSVVAARLLAANYLEKAMKQPNSTAYVLAAEVYDRFFLLDESLSYVKKAVALAPNDYWSLHILGRELILMGRPKQGLVYLNRALELDPQNPGRIWQTMSLAEFCIGDYKRAVLLGERVREYNPTTTSIGGILAISYAQLDQLSKAKEAFLLYKRGWPPEHPPTIPLVMMFYNHADPETSNTIVESMVKAGLPSVPSVYYKPWNLERLPEAEIKNLLLGKTMTGLGLFSGKQWWWEIDSDGAFRTRGGNFGEKGGSLWIEDNLLCANIPKITRGLKIKGAVFKNKEGRKENNNQYLLAAIWGLMPFSIE